MSQASSLPLPRPAPVRQAPPAVRSRSRRPGTRPAPIQRPSCPPAQLRVQAASLQHWLDLCG